MSRFAFKLKTPNVSMEFVEFLKFVRKYAKIRVYRWFVHFEFGKDVVVDLLYKKRGKYVRPFLHFGAVGLVFVGITFGPLILETTAEDSGGQVEGVMTAQAFGSSFSTQQSQDVIDLREGEVIIHIVQEEETLSSIAQRYNLQLSTVLWENNLTETSTIKPGQELRILPIDGVLHKVSRGETVFSIAKKYKLIEGDERSGAQAIVDYPFNDFLNDETFELATGQQIMVPNGIKPDIVVPRANPVASRPFVPVATTPDAGAVSASGQFIWPAAGKVTQAYFPYHRAIDIANRGGGPILAADSGTVSQVLNTAGGYGNHIVVDHGNGFSTLYAHLSVMQVRPGQSVNRGDVLGQMGSTGRSTGVHLHFEIRQDGVFHNPLSFLPR